MLPLPAVDHGELIGTAFEQAWQKHAPAASSETPAEGKKFSEETKEKDNEDTTRLRKALMEIMGSRFLFAGVVKAVNTALQFCFPLLLNAILRFIEETQGGAFDETDPWHVQYRGYWLSAVLLVAMASKAVTENGYFHIVYRSAYQAKTAISVAVYNKSLRLTNAERQSTTLGKFVLTL